MGDSEATLVKLKPKPTTVAWLRHLKPRGSLGSRTSGIETTVFQIRGRLVAAKNQEDGDIHLIVKGIDPDNKGTMITELPNPSCLGKTPAQIRTRMRAARWALTHACGGEPPAHAFVELIGTAVITGVGFFDTVHGQYAVAPNGIELHPLFSFYSLNCKRGKKLTASGESD
jgi:hypothetical protein